MIGLRQTVRIIGIILLLGLGLSCVLFSILPSLIETRILPRIARQAGFPSLNCRINNLGFTQTSAGPLTLGATAEPAVTIERLTLLYNPALLRKGKLKKVVLSGVSIKTVFHKGTLLIPGLKEITDQSDENKTFNKESNKSSPSPSKLPIPPFAELEIKRSVILSEAAGREYRIPFSLRLRKSTAPKPETTILNGTLMLYPRNQPITLKFTASLNEKEGIHLSLQVPKVDLLNCTVSDIDISIRNNPGNTSLQGHWTTRLAGRHGPFIWTKPLLKKWHLTANLDPQGDWKAHLDSPTDDSVWQLQKGELTITGNSPAITLNACGQEKKIVSATLLQLAKVHIKQQNLDLKLPELLLRGELRQKDSTTPSMAATLQFTDGTLEVADYDLQVLGIAGTLPWHWPANEQTAGRKGKLDCQKIFLQEFDLGRFAASLQQQENNVLLKGRYDCALIAGLKMLVKGQCGLDRNDSLQAAATFEIPACKPENPVALVKYVNSAGSSTIDGTLSAYGELSYKACGISGSATAVVEKALFRNDEKNLLCSGIGCRLQFPELPSLRSAPDQKLVFERLTAGNIICPGGTLSFQVESEKTLLLEKSRISWCGGNIETQALRISPAVDHYQSTLYCDRLQLAELLEQLGQVEARGQGSVNGRIPVTWEKGRITFDDGFLYSTPGAGGTIKISGGEALTAGLPTASPQFAQLDLAREALKDYQYQWAKLSLNSEAEELILNLQFDGRPNLPLPFVYKKELGSFVRVTAGSPGSLFQGINLDINLRLPLNRILQYKDLSTMIE